MEEKFRLLTDIQYVESLKLEIRDVFGDVEFPSHCGLHAAIAMDDWIDDPLELKRITDEQDIKAKWWEIPDTEFTENSFSLATCYFDEFGTEFYLPAFLTFVLNDKSYSAYNSLILWLLPSEEDDLYEYFLKMFSRIDSSRKNVCVKVLKYIQHNLLDPRDNISYQMINAIIDHPFWKI